MIVHFRVNDHHHQNVLSIARHDDRTSPRLTDQRKHLLNAEYHPTAIDSNDDTQFGFERTFMAYSSANHDDNNQLRMVQR